LLPRQTQAGLGVGFDDPFVPGLANDGTMAKVVVGSRPTTFAFSALSSTPSSTS
jgi:hypothetical protein